MRKVVIEQILIATNHKINIMSEQTLIDLFGLYIQASGIFIALVSVYAFFRLEKIKDLLIGQGMAVFKSQTEIKKGEIEDPQLLKLPDIPELCDIYFRRLRDSIDRKNIYGIEEGLIRIAIKEIKTNSKTVRGYCKNILPKFIETKRYQKCIKCLSMLVISLFVITIILCFFSIRATEYGYQYYDIDATTLFYIVSFLFIVSLIMTACFIYKSNSKLVGFEKVTKEECCKLKNENPEIKKLY